MKIRENDMYGHRIWPLGETGYGVSVSYYHIGKSCPSPLFTFFHVSDEFRQTLFGIQIDRGKKPTLCNIFEDRVVEVQEWEKERVDEAAEYLSS